MKSWKLFYQMTLTQTTSSNVSCLFDACRYKSKTQTFEQKTYTILHPLASSVVPWESVRLWKYGTSTPESWGHSVTDWPTGSTLFTLGQSDDATMNRHMSPVTYAVCWPLQSSRKPEAKDAERNPTQARMTLSYSSADDSRYTNYLPLRLMNILIKNRVTEQWRKPSKTLFVLLNCTSTQLDTTPQRYIRSGGIAPLFLNFRITWRLVISFMPPLRRIQNRYGRLEEKNHQALRGIEPRFLDRPASHFTDWAIGVPPGLIKVNNWRRPKWFNASKKETVQNCDRKSWKE